MKKLARLVWLVPVIAGCQAAAQTLDNGGNNMMQGSYYFREVIYLLAQDGSGNLGRAIAFYGTLSFSGSGSYTMTSVQAFDSNVGAIQTVPSSTAGTYTISSSGLGFINNPLTGVPVNGLVSQQGIFVGSATEAGINDMFVAAPLASPLPTNASFKGSYAIADFDFSSGSAANAAGFLFSVSPDGAGNLGTVSANGYFAGGGTTVYSQSITGVKYNFSNGGCNLAFPNNNNATFISGQRFLYISPDGNFVFGGSPAAWDMFVGVRTGTGTPALNGLYYEAGIDEDQGYFDTYFGSLNASGGSIVDHQRTLSQFYSAVPYGNMFSDVYSVKSDGTYNNGVTRYIVGNGIRIGSGLGPFVGLNVALAAPALSGSGVYLNPAGVVNAASSSPFTAGIAPGELITLYGNNLASALTIASAIPYPNSLGSVQVTINGLAAPIYYVSPGAVSVIVPYAISGSVAQVQVNNNGSLSNTVSVLVNKTVPGVSQTQNGLGYGAIIHLDGTLVTPSHPAAIGETVSVFLTGLGLVDPLVPDGSAGPSSPLSQTTNTIAVDVSGTTATVLYAGLAPQLAGLYQINFTLPAGLTAGDNFVDIVGPDSYNAQALISVAASSSAQAVAQPEAVKRPRHPVKTAAPR